MNVKSFLIISILLSAVGVNAQGVFESSLSGSPASGADRLSIGGYTRGALFLGLIPEQDPLLRSLYSETSLKLKYAGGSWGGAFTDIRFRTGVEYGDNVHEINIREAYADFNLGRLGLRFGKQILSWGRADGFNPTDNLTPKNYFVRSGEPDDLKQGNLLLRAQYQPFDFLRLEADLIPWYVPSQYRFDLVGMPAFVAIDPVSHPGFAWDGCAVGAKADLIFGAIEGALSWYSGYDHLPALAPGQLPAPPFTDFTVHLMQKPYRQQVFGADFATTLLGTGLRGEFAVKIPEEDSANPFRPNTEYQWVVSLDRGFGPFRLIAAYNGKWVDDFVPADPPGEFNPALLADPTLWPFLEGMFASQIGYYNRILFDQTHEISHTLLFRPSLQLFHEAL
ncbi:MAG: hypothetical protein R6V75_00810, partial [Bacteroidales bacterium]